MRGVGVGGMYIRGTGCVGMDGEELAFGVVNAYLGVYGNRKSGIELEREKAVER